jgi:hypothetical protein
VGGGAVPHERDGLADRDDIVIVVIIHDHELELWELLPEAQIGRGSQTRARPRR